MPCHASIVARLLTVHLDVDPFADGGQDAVSGDTQVGAHMEPTDAGDVELFALHHHHRRRCNQRSVGRGYEVTSRCTPGERLYTVKKCRVRGQAAGRPVYSVDEIQSIRTCAVR